jgi:hypothetical protein
MTRECHVRFCEGLEVRVLWSTYLCEKSEVKYELICAHPEYPVTKWAACLDVSTSAYYDWLAKKDEWDSRMSCFSHPWAEN